jgi:hypothetical protein
MAPIISSPVILFPLRCWHISAAIPINVVQLNWNLPTLTRDEPDELAGALIYASASLLEDLCIFWERGLHNTPDCQGYEYWLFCASTAAGTHHLGLVTSDAACTPLAPYRLRQRALSRFQQCPTFLPCWDWSWLGCNRHMGKLEKFPCKALK